ncbi:MAG: hypothetical protein M3N47_00005, partial [Chloroflexota bacterium]|nr:hypothetical protein [Chloroflexota bacterium]
MTARDVVPARPDAMAHPTEPGGMSGPDHQPTDAALMERLRGHDQDAFAMLYDRYASAVHGLALMVLRDAALAEDVTHDVFLRVWQRPDAFEAGRG